MYVLIEGMPGTGKTTVAKKLAADSDSVYIKSVISDSEFGEKIKILRDEKIFGIDFLYFADLLLDELRVQKILHEGKNIIRDKSWIGTLAHLQVNGYSDDSVLNELLIMGYEQLRTISIVPDHVIFFEPNLDMTQKISASKKDVSKIDEYLWTNRALYLRQNAALEKLLDENFSDRLIKIKSFSADAEQTTNFLRRCIFD